VLLPPFPPTDYKFVSIHLKGVRRRFNRGTVDQKLPLKRPGGGRGEPELSHRLHVANFCHIKISPTHAKRRGSSFLSVETRFWYWARGRRENSREKCGERWCAERTRLSARLPLIPRGKKPSPDEVQNASVGEVAKSSRCAQGSGVKSVPPEQKPTSARYTPSRQRRDA
jgi:hypothetical protein